MSSPSAHPAHSERVLAEPSQTQEAMESQTGSSGTTIRTQSAPPSSFFVPLQALLGIIVVAVFIVTFSVQPFSIPSSSMVPTLLVGDFLLVDKQTATLDHLPLAPGRLQRGDVVVFHYPPNPSVHLVKRIIGLPGDRVRLHDGRVLVNGKALTEPYAVYRPSLPDPYRDDFPHLTSTDPEVDSRWWMELQHLDQNGELYIPPNEYFVLGDNRNNSEDSRYWGLVPAGNVVGKPLLVYLSLRGDPAGESDQERARAEPQSAWARARSLARWQRALHIVR